MAGTALTGGESTLAGAWVEGVTGDGGAFLRGGRYG